MGLKIGLRELVLGLTVGYAAAGCATSDRLKNSIKNDVVTGLKGDMAAIQVDFNLDGVKETTLIYWKESAFKKPTLLAVLYNIDGELPEAPSKIAFGSDYLNTEYYPKQGLLGTDTTGLAEKVQKYIQKHFDK